MPIHCVTKSETSYEPAGLSPSIHKEAPGHDSIEVSLHLESHGIFRSYWLPIDVILRSGAFPSGAGTLAAVLEPNHFLNHRTREIIECVVKCEVDRRQRCPAFSLTSNSKKCT